MPLTQQIIKDIVRSEIKDQTEARFDKIDEKFDKIDEKFDKIDEKFDKIDEKFDKMNKKIDFLTDTVVDLAGQFRNFGEELTVISGQMSDRTDRIEKLEATVFGPS